MKPGDLIKRFLNLNPFKTITGAIAWTLATAATGFIAAVGVVFVANIRSNASIVDLVQKDEYAVAAILAVFIPLVAGMGATFVLCVTARSLVAAYNRIFKRSERQKPQQKKPAAEKIGAVIPFEQRKTSATQ